MIELICRDTHIIFLFKKFMKLFNTLLEIKTANKNLVLKTVFIDNALYQTE
jgi:hypothetical protein